MLAFCHPAESRRRQQTPPQEGGCKVAMPGDEDSERGSVVLFLQTACGTGMAALNPRPNPPSGGKPRHRAVRFLVRPGPGRAGTGTQALGSSPHARAGLVLGTRGTCSRALTPRDRGPASAPGKRWEAGGGPLPAPSGRPVPAPRSSFLRKPVAAVRGLSPQAGAWGSRQAVPSVAFIRMPSECAGGS